MLKAIDDTNCVVSFSFSFTASLAKPLALIFGGVKNNVLSRTEVVQHIGLRHHGRAFLSADCDAEIAAANCCAAPEKVFEPELPKFLL